MVIFAAPARGWDPRSWALKVYVALEILHALVDLGVGDRHARRRRGLLDGHLRDRAPSATSPSGAAVPPGTGRT